jgi:integrase/recombinase XerD
MNPENETLILKQREILSFRDLSDGTIATYISYLSQFLSWTENVLHKPAEDVSWNDIRTYIKHLKHDRKIGNRTINVHIAQLHHFWQYVLKRDWDKYEVPFLKFDTVLPAVPTTTEISSIIDATSNIKHRAELALLYSSGIRVSELTHLHCRDIWASKNSIFIERSKNRSERYAVLSTKAFAILRTYISDAYPSAGKDDWLFPGQKAGLPINDQSVRNVFNKAAAAAGLAGKGFTLHSCRHAFGLHLYEAGTDIMTIKEALGHKSLSSTEIYLALGIGNGRSVKSPYDL